MKKNLKYLLIIIILSIIIFVGVKFGYPSYYSAKGTQYFKEGNLEEAEDNFKKSAELESSVGMLKLGNLYEYQKKDNLAEKYYKKALDNGEKRAACGLERIYRKYGNTEEIKIYEQFNSFMNESCKNS